MRYAEAILRRYAKDSLKKVDVRVVFEILQEEGKKSAEKVSTSVTSLSLLIY